MTQHRSIPRVAPTLSLLLALALAGGTLQSAADEPKAGEPAASPAPAATEHGKAERLVSEHCIKCHGSEVYTRPDRKVTSLGGLERQVRRCETALELTWFDDDIADVAHYLNRQYYHFK